MDINKIYQTNKNNDKFIKFALGENVKQAKQAIKYIVNHRTSIIAPSIHFQILIDAALVSTEELQENAILILAF